METYLSRKNSFTFFLTFFVYFLLYLFISASAFYNDFTHDRIIAFAEKARLAVEGHPPRLENTGFVYPPLPILLFAIFKYPFLVQAFVGGLVAAWLFHFLKEKKDLFLLALLHFHLGFLYLLGFEFDTLLFFFMSAFVSYSLLRYFQTGLSLHLFSAGLVNGFTFFVNFSSLILSIYYLPLFLLRKGESLQKRIGLITVFLSPILFFFLAYSYLNYLFKEDFFYYLKSVPREFYHEPELKLFLASLLGGLPYLLGFFALREGRYFYLFPLFPWLVFSAFSFPDTLYLSIFSYSVFYLIFLFVFSPYMKVNRTLKLSSLLAILLSYLLAFYYGNLWEKNFLSFFLGGNHIRNLEDARVLANFINQREGKFLMDDKVFYREVFFVKDLKKLVLPYMYSYNTYLLSPAGNVNYIITSQNSRDDVYNNYKDDILRYKLDECYFYGRISNAIVFKCN